MSFLIVAYLVSVMLCFNKLCDATTPNELLLSRAQILGTYESSKQNFRSYTSAPLKDQVHFLPGWGQLERFNMFSGQIHTHGTKRPQYCFWRALHLLGGVIATTLLMLMWGMIALPRILSPSCWDSWKGFHT
ncbi:hypothetical protein CEUSTIGMA_g7077.t1 [Chlamydomonas eustigma]|uniref:Uncharacterized protein n=1 Tax=Chlamydomonas eustigma TaxID=1157962 RepID=A0A250X989_9CHLO|nr:hypothetical protein CEUSTIGMA_g7077.t1 [Chlamydomonas eustigma]|eukprot:GAX79636.1 hypothetical protein CEUSTIGMA_g7077.t1 [Chlamydomonas eustigma]